MKTLITLLLVYSSFSLFAQENLIEQLKSDVLRSKNMTLAYVNNIPEEKLTERPGEGSRTFAQQILHLSQGMINLSSNGFGSTPLYAAQNLEKDSTYYNKVALINIVEESHNYVIDGLDNVDLTTLDEIIERGPFKVTRLGWIMKSLEHTSHHRGQCAVYFRVLDMEAPTYQLF